MKVIVAGATGTIGGGALKRLLDLPTVTSVVALSRRKLELEHSKLKVAIVKDFLHYEPDVLEQLSGAEACVWALGTPTSGREIHMDYAMAAVEALQSTLEQGQPFRFVLVSGSLVEADQTKTLWLLSGMRKMRGEVETKILDLEKNDTNEQWTSFVAKPSMVTNGESIMRFVASSHYIPLAELGAALADVAVAGGERRVLDNGELRQRGQAALKAA